MTTIMAELDDTEKIAIERMTAYKHECMDQCRTHGELVAMIVAVRGDIKEIKTALTGDYNNKGWLTRVQAVEDEAARIKAVQDSAARKLFAVITALIIAVAGFIWDMIRRGAGI